MHPARSRRWGVRTNRGTQGHDRAAQGRRRVAALLFAAAAVLYNGWLLEFVLPTGLDPRHSYVSELYAADQPLRWLFGGIESVCAVLVGGGALLAGGAASGIRVRCGIRSRTIRARTDWWARAGWWALLGLALSSLADVYLPMRCAPSVEPGCEAVHPWHTATSALAHFFVFASMALLGRAAATDAPRMPLIRRWGTWVLALALPTAVCTVGPLFGRPGWHGIPQRAHLTLVGVWFALLAAELAGASRQEDREPEAGRERVPEAAQPADSG
ncbi:DUF998 domain-containing protein [Streptomyces inhibens]|uniref:DUF998 domain-containing protein n=1 Tax=Streptomyces inhibens TaxID=2293571 RepID=A0A371PTM0_STRIH|nr:DUF998 domain-containing protein [Streptomyces inhibens]REK85824.1 DUF998 domain-containing protein [Streptomyces inhibens]